MRLKIGKINRDFPSKISGGLTIIELLVSIGILVIVGSIVSAVTMFSLRGANKANTMEQIRQTGNFVINQMTKTITNAQTYDGVRNSGSDPYSTACLPYSTTPNQYEYVKVTPFSGSSVEYKCDDSPTFTVNGADIFSGSVHLVECSLSCIQQDSGDIPIVNISFKLESANAGNNFVENSTVTEFKTSVVVKNYRR